MMPYSAADCQTMARAIQLAEKGKYTTHPNPRVGCVIVKHNQIIGEGWHKRAGQAHAEINALNSTSESVQGATAYVTLEPCSHTGKTPPCANALIESGISRVVIAMQDPNPQVAGQGIQQLADAGIEVECGLLEEQSRQLNPGFIKRMEQGLPWVRIKLAMSLDGCTAMASGESKWITGAEARQDVQRLRASADAILTGIGTVIADDPSLNIRIDAKTLGLEGEVIQPKRIILDTHLKTPLTSRLFSLEGQNLIATSNTDAQLIKQYQEQGVDVLLFDQTATGHLPLKSVLRHLAKQEINEVHVEAGATLCGALIQENLVDEIVIYMAPTFMGSNARGLLDLSGLDKMKDKVELSIQDIRAVGDDWRITALLK